MDFIINILSKICTLISSIFTPKLDVKVDIKEESLIFMFKYKNINGMLNFLTSENDRESPFWRLKMNYFREQKLLYGVIPTSHKTFSGSTNQVQQIFPENNEKPTSYIENKKINVRIDYQYDTFLTACTGWKTFSFMIVDNQIKNFKET
ncbi:MAG: hypothetical protein RBR08_16585 [Desulforegulaceae bacterium]|nr:hypothetical protein [Desulforegulaceae bacterium]